MSGDSDDVCDALCCCCLYCAAECAGGCIEAGASGDGKSCCALTAIGFLVLLVVAAVALAVCLSVRPVRVTVEDASLTRLAPTPAASANGTTMKLAYAVSLSVTLRNPNVVMRVEHTQPLDADLRFAGRRLVFTRLRTAGRHPLLRPKERAVYRVVAAGESVDDIGRDAMAEFVKESTAGVVKLELKVTGEVRYPPHRGKHRIDATFPLTFPSSLITSPGPAGGEKTTMKSDTNSQI